MQIDSSQNFGRISDLIVKLNSFLNILVIDYEVTIKNSSILCENQNCGECAISILEIMESKDQTYQDFLTEYQELDQDFGSASRDRSLSKLSCHPTGTHKALRGDLTSTFRHF